MNKTTAFYVMVAGILASGYDLMTTEAGATAGKLYGPGKPLESFRWKVYTSPAVAAAGTVPASAVKDYYVSATDVMAAVGAWFYFKG